MGSIILGKHLFYDFYDPCILGFHISDIFFRIDAMILGNPMKLRLVKSECDSKGPKYSNRPVTRKWRFPQNPLQKGYAFALKLHSRKDLMVDFNFNHPVTLLVFEILSTDKSCLHFVV